MFPSCNISPGFCLLALWFGYANGWGLLETVLGAAAFHEIGHWLALRWMGGKVTAMRIGLWGAVMETDSRCLSYPGEIGLALAGPAANLLAAWWLIRWEEPVAAGAHLVLAAVNLLPLWPLDGGRALMLLTSWLWGPEAGDRTARWVGVLAAALFAGSLLYVIWRTRGSLWLLPAVVGAVGAGGRNFFGNLQE